MMNLCEFLENMHPDCFVIVEMNGEIIMGSKVGDISAEDSCMYWIQAESISLNGDDIMHIPVVLR